MQRPDSVRPALATPLPGVILPQSLDLEVVQNTHHRPMIGLALMLALIAGGLDGAATLSALPTISTQLNGLTLMTWAVTLPLVAGALTVPIFGKLSDSIGRKPLILASLLLSMTGAIFASFCTSMPWFLAARFIQGAGIYAVAPLVSTLTADLFDMRARGKFQAWLTAAWGAASTLGPALASFLLSYDQWRAVLWLSVIPSLAATGIIYWYYRDPPRTGTTILRLSGLIEAAAACSLALIALDHRTAPTWYIRVLVGLFAITLGYLSIRSVKQGKTSLVSTELLRESSVRIALMGSTLVGGVLHSMSVFVPLWLSQNPGHLSAPWSITFLLGGWAVGSSGSVAATHRFGAPKVGQVGSTIMLTGAVVTALSISFSWPAFILVLGLLACGIGMAPCSNSLLVTAQDKAPWRDRGSLTSAFHAVRTLGGALSVATLNALSTVTSTLWVFLFIPMLALVMLGLLLSWKPDEAV